MTLDERKRRLGFRATHRGTREADMIIGGFVMRHMAGWGEAEVAWAEALIAEPDVDIMAWALGKASPPGRLAGPLMAALMRLDYVELPR
ncbi:MAG: succinate dehydrogenase assembly factor 2 [Sphingomonadaceae bacterium]